MLKPAELGKRKQGSPYQIEDVPRVHLAEVPQIVVLSSLLYPFTFKLMPRGGGQKKTGNR